LVSRVCDLMKEPYPELVNRRENISGIILSEEERFISSLKDGLNFLEQEIVELKKQDIKEIPGEIIFKLYDTFGLPVEYTATNAQANGLSLNLVGFNEEMEKQKKRAREGSAMSSDIFSKDILEILPSQFVGYEIAKQESQVIQIIKAKQNTHSIKQGDEAWVVLDKTPFYGESGGQIGDT
jgi:alanyl-tRNA synthetase